MATIIQAPTGSLTDIPNPAAAPQVPKTLEDTGLRADFVEQLLVKTLYTGEATGLAVADRMRLPFGMLEPLIEVRGTTGSGSGSAGYRYALTDAGRERARQYVDANQYIGPAPVPLSAY